MVESSSTECDEKIAEIRKLFYEDEPLKSYKMLQAL